MWSRVSRVQVPSLTPFELHRTAPAGGITSTRVVLLRLGELLAARLARLAGTGFAGRAGDIEEYDNGEVERGGVLVTPPLSLGLLSTSIGLAAAVWPLSLLLMGGAWFAWARRKEGEAAAAMATTA